LQGSFLRKRPWLVLNMLIPAYNFYCLLSHLFGLYKKMQPLVGLNFYTFSNLDNQL
jgi:hypothetical protein